eukprot:1507806-Rhodomonas_salina.1
MILISGGCDSLPGMPGFSSNTNSMRHRNHESTLNTGGPGTRVPGYPCMLCQGRVPGYPGTSRRF